ncbi:MAG: LapA family protein [Betaproteobacteria bacterium]|nr:LapA family protein [Betaproteobacteria bacterium]
MRRHADDVRAALGAGGDPLRPAVPSPQNAELVTLKFYHWWSWQAPLVFVVLVAFAGRGRGGLLAGAVAARLKRQRTAAPAGNAGA